jgi:hypothetical protein
VSALEQAARDFVDAWFRFRTDDAAACGYTPCDDRPPSFAPDDVARLRAAVARARAVVHHDGDAALPLDARIDAALLRSHLDTALFDIDCLHVLDRSPLFYVAAAMEGVDALETRIECGEEGLVPALGHRLAGVAPLLDQARAQVREPVEPFRRAAMETLSGAVEHLHGRYDTRLHPRPLREAAVAARAAMERYLDDLDTQAGVARPFTPMGPELYGRLLAHEHLVAPDPAPWLHLARDTLARIPPAAPDSPAAARPAVPERFGRHDVLEYYRHELATMRRFVEEHDLATIPDGEIVLRETPEWIAATSPGASYVPPPAFSASRSGIFYISGVPHEMDEETRRDYFDVVRHRRMRNLVAHEVWPGHHLQFLHAAGHPSPLRRYRDNHVMVEGWALYCEQLVGEQGLYDVEAAAEQQEWLRFRALRVLVDVGIHTGSMSLDEAERFLVAAFRHRGADWLHREVRRYASEPTQAFSYLVGQRLVNDLRDEWMEAARPGTSLRAFHDRFLAEGSIALPLIRRKMLESLASD